jgi:hypothetical protein
MTYHFVPNLCIKLSVVLVLAASPLLTMNVGAQAQDQAEQADDPSKGSKDVDQIVAYPMNQVLEAAKLAMATYGCDIKKEKPDSVECTRSRRMGVFMGSGGEKVTVRVTSKGAETQVVVKTGKGFVGRLAKKNWSTPIFNEILKNLAS